MSAAIREEGCPPPTETNDTSEIVDKIFCVLGDGENQETTYRRFFEAITLNGEIQALLASRESLKPLLNAQKIEEVLQRVDVNQDNVISAAEVLRFAGQLQPMPAGDEELPLPRSTGLPKEQGFVHDLHIIRDQTRADPTEGTAEAFEKDQTAVKQLEEDEAREKTVKKVFSAIDPRHGGQIQRNQFLRAIQLNRTVQIQLGKHPVLKALLNAHNLNAQLNTIDADGDGQITVKEMIEFAKVVAATPEAQRKAADEKEREQRELEVATEAKRIANEAAAAAAVAEEQRRAEEAAELELKRQRREEAAALARKRKEEEAKIIAAEKKAEEEAERKRIQAEEKRKRLEEEEERHKAAFREHERQKKEALQEKQRQLDEKRRIEAHKVKKKTVGSWIFETEAEMQYRENYREFKERNQAEAKHMNEVMRRGDSYFIKGPQADALRNELAARFAAEHLPGLNEDSEDSDEEEEKEEKEDDYFLEPSLSPMTAKMKVALPTVLTEEEGALLEDAQLEHAATKIQSVARGRQTRSQMSRQRRKSSASKRIKAQSEKKAQVIEKRMPLDSINTHGIDLSIYSRLWIRDPDVVPLLANGKLLRLPHTIVFMHGAPTAWYFTSKDSHVYLRRKKKKVTPDEIIKHFSTTFHRTKHAGAHKIVGTWMTNSKETGSRTRQFLTFEELRKMVLQGCGRSFGVLQEYIETPGGYRQTTRVDWTRHIQNVEMCESRFGMRNHSVTVEKRLADFDSLDGHVYKQKIPRTSKKGILAVEFSAAIANRLETIANVQNGNTTGRMLLESSTNTVSDPLEKFLNNSSVSFEQQRPFLSIRLHRGIFNFVVGADGGTYFTHSSFLDVGEITNSRGQHYVHATGLYSSPAEIIALANSNQAPPSPKGAIKCRQGMTALPRPVKNAAVLESLGLTPYPDFGEKAYAEYADENYALERENDDGENTVFTSESMLLNKGKLLRKFLRRYSYNQFGRLDPTEMFRLFHTKTGTLTGPDFKTFFQEVNIDMTARQLKRVINLIDVDGDGRIEIDEFLEWMMETEENESPREKFYKVDFHGTITKSPTSPKRSPVSPVSPSKQKNLFQPVLTQKITRTDILATPAITPTRPIGSKGSKSVREMEHRYLKEREHRKQTPVKPKPKTSMKTEPSYKIYGKVGIHRPSSSVRKSSTKSQPNRTLVEAIGRTI